MLCNHTDPQKQAHTHTHTVRQALQSADMCTFSEQTHMPINHTRTHRHTNGSINHTCEEITHRHTAYAYVCVYFVPMHILKKSHLASTGLCPCQWRVKMQIINPILFQGESRLGMWLWNPVWIVPNLTWSTILCVSPVLSCGNVKDDQSG